MKNSIKFLFILLTIFISCKSEKQKLAEKIAVAEKTLQSDTTHFINRQSAEETIRLYLDYSGKFKDDSLSAEYLFKAGDLANGTGDFLNAIRYYKMCSENASYPKKEIAFFLTGFIYENQLQDLENARQVYTEFLKKYPEHSLAKDVQFSLDNLGKSPEELIKMFDLQDSTVAASDTNQKI